MSFVSYAQNFEDVMLWRALKNVQNGFYIDVGANDPAVDSVTKAFYERGWSGINIEPLPTHYADLVQERPRDINLQCAAGATTGEIEIWECDVRGWATASAEVIAQHSSNGHAGVFHKVPVRMLSEICAQYAPGEIHFLKIDVEGFEKSVIEGMDFSRFRPWILVIEATRPNSTEEIHDEWEGEVLSADYVLAYTDGLNRFYVAKEHSELLNLLRYPPNVFDEFIRSEFLNSELRAQQAETEVQRASAGISIAQAEVRTAQAEAQEANARASIAEAETRASIAEAETRTAQAVAQAQQANARAAIAEAETRTAQAEAQAQEANARASIAEAETRTAQAVAQAQQANARAAIAEAETRTAQAEAQAQEANARASIAEAETRTAQAEAQAQAQQASARAAIAEAETRTAELDAKLEATGQELHNLHQSNHHHWQLAEARHQQVEALLGSTSWRVTAPLRWAGLVVRDPFLQTLKQRSKLLLQHAALYIDRRPVLKNAATKLLHRFPSVKARLAQTIGQTAIQPSLLQSTQSLNRQVDLADLTPHARQIYADLKAAIERQQKERS
jgi:FkbM family methyltransferase